MENPTVDAMTRPRVGRGKVVVSTFRLMGDGADADPVATALWDGLIELALGE